MTIMPVVISADIGGTNLRIGLIDQKGNVLKKIKLPSHNGNLLEALIDAITELITPETVGISLAIAGVVDRKKGQVIHSPNLQEAEGINFIEALGNRFSLPVIIENDANAAALGEHWAGAARGYESAVMLTLGTGIGGAVIYKGRLLEVAAELGHITVEADGIRCLCGNNGCLESYASARAMVTRVVDALEKGEESLLKNCCDGNIYKITSEDIYHYALEGDTLARETLKNAGRYLGVGIASLVNIFSPEAVVIGGGLIGAWNILVEEAKKEAQKRAFNSLMENLKILPAQLGDDAGMVGAASLVFRQ